jgi:hypothetical protein
LTEVGPLWQLIKFVAQVVALEDVVQIVYMELEVRNGDILEYRKLDLAVRGSI